MKNALSRLLLVTSSVLILALQGPGLWAKFADQGNVVALGDLKSQVPADWVEEKPGNTQCYKQYRLEPVDDDKYDAQETIFFVGKEKGNSAADYVQRWKGMFFPPLGKTMAEAAKVRRLTVNGAAATCVDVRGDYKGVPGDNTSPRQNFRLLGVYLNTPKGPHIIRLLGPADTVASYHKEFVDWVKAFK